MDLKALSGLLGSVWVQVNGTGGHHLCLRCHRGCSLSCHSSFLGWTCNWKVVQKLYLIYGDWDTSIHKHWQTKKKSKKSLFSVRLTSQQRNSVRKEPTCLFVASQISAKITGLRNQLKSSLKPDLLTFYLFRFVCQRNLVCSWRFVRWLRFLCQEGISMQDGRLKIPNFKPKKCILSGDCPSGTWT